MKNEKVKENKHWNSTPKSFCCTSPVRLNTQLSLKSCSTETEREREKKNNLATIATGHRLEIKEYVLAKPMERHPHCVSARKDAQWFYAKARHASGLQKSR